MTAGLFVLTPGAIVAPQYFGLSGAITADVAVAWPGGTTQTLKAVEANAVVKVTP